MSRRWRWRIACGIVRYQPIFGIDLHVDNSEGVRMEGDEHGFRVLVVRPDDTQWAQKVLDSVARVKAI